MTSARMQALKVAEGGWLGSQKKPESGHVAEVQRLLDRGFELLKWDGK